MKKSDSDYSLVRFLHAALGEGTVDVYLNRNPFFYNMRFTKFSPYIYVPNGEYLLQVFPRDKKINPILEQQLEVSGGKMLTIALVGEKTKLEILPIQEDTEIYKGDKSKVRFVNLIPNSIDIDVYFDGEVFVEGSYFKGISKYKLMNPEVYRVEVVLKENEQLIRELRIRINQNRIYTLYAMGNKPNFQIFQSLDGATFLN